MGNLTAAMFDELNAKHVEQLALMSHFMALILPGFGREVRSARPVAPRDGAGARVAGRHFIATGLENAASPRTTSAHAHHVCTLATSAM